MRVDAWLLLLLLISAVKPARVNLVVLHFKVVVVACFWNLLLFFGVESLLLLGKNLLMLLLDSPKFVMSLLVDSLKFILIVLVDNILNLNDVFWLELPLHTLSGWGSHNWHLLWGCFSVLWFGLLASGAVSWWDFDLSDGVTNLASAAASHTSFFGMSIGLLAGSWLYNGKLTIRLSLNIALIKHLTSNVLLMLLDLSFSFSVIWRDQLFFISILKIWIVSISFLFFSIHLWLEGVLIIFLLQGWSKFRFIIFFFIVLWFSVCWSSYFRRWHSHRALWVLWSIFWLFALSQARFCSRLWTLSLLIHASASTLFHYSVVLVSICIVLLIILLVCVLVVSLVSLASLVIRLHIFIFYLIYNF